MVAEGCYVWDAPGTVTWTACPGLFTVQVGHGPPGWPPPRRNGCRRWPTSPSGPAAEPLAGAGGRLTGMAPATSTACVLHHRRARLSDTAWARPPVLQGSVGSRSLRCLARPPATAPRWARCRSPTCQPSKGAVSSRWSPARSRSATSSFLPDRPRQRVGRDLRSGHRGPDPHGGADTVAAVYLEPVQNTGGTLPPPPGYFAARSGSATAGVLLVSDGVICAFGRLGSGSDRIAGTRPDVTFAKGRDVGLLARSAGARQRPWPSRSFSRHTRPSCTASPSAAHRSGCGVAMRNHLMEHEDLLGSAWAGRRASRSASRACSAYRSIVGTSEATGSAHPSGWSGTPTRSRPSPTRRCAWLLGARSRTGCSSPGLMCPLSNAAPVR